MPGLGISLVRNGAVLNKGYGSKARLDPPVAFDEFTVSNIGSTTKAFTAALIGVLITESKQKNGRQHYYKLFRTSCNTSIRRNVTEDFLSYTFI